MTIRTAILCDKCDAVYVPETRHLPRGGLIREAHNAGWTSQSDSNGWQNICPDHKAEAA